MSACSGHTLALPTCAIGDSFPLLTHVILGILASAAYTAAVRPAHSIREMTTIAKVAEYLVADNMKLLIIFEELNPLLRRKEGVETQEDNQKDGSDKKGSEEATLQTPGVEPESPTSYSKRPSSASGCEPCTTSEVPVQDAQSARRTSVREYVEWAMRYQKMVKQL
ncbi:hypothetical protein B0H19DRAFT_1055531 [Mycena capillaripes]|nr:hypothetical protein B0H19DRAFT_1055531 [Mycena capillaripes]